MILNLTQHAATADQIAAGVVDLPADARQQLSELLTFDFLPTLQEIADRAISIARFAVEQGILAGCFDEETGTGAAMLGGAPFLMTALEFQLAGRGITPLYAFSRRESVETVQPDGSVIKTNVFKHVGFIGVLDGVQE